MARNERQFAIEHAVSRIQKACAEADTAASEILDILRDASTNYGDLTQLVFQLFDAIRFNIPKHKEQTLGGLDALVKLKLAEETSYLPITRAKPEKSN